MTRLIVFILAAMFSISGTASMHEDEEHSAKSDKKTGLPAFSKVDQNEDQQLSWEEAKSLNIPKEEFEKADYDDDGKISRTMYEFTFGQEQS